MAKLRQQLLPAAPYIGLAAGCVWAIDSYAPGLDLAVLTVLLASICLTMLVVYCIWSAALWLEPYLGHILVGVLALVLIVVIAVILWVALIPGYLSLVASGASILYFLGRSAKWAYRYALRVFRQWGVVVDEDFSNDDVLESQWEVQRGAPTQMISAQPGQGLRVRWESGQPQEQSGYLLKNLPDVPLKVEAELRASQYEAGWDPGLHFYPADGKDFCLALSLIPAGHPGPTFTTSGLSLRTQDPERPPWIDHPRIEVLPGQTIRVVVILRGTQVTVRRGSDVSHLTLVCKPGQLVVGCFRWSGPPTARGTAEHFIKWIRVRKL